MRADNKVELVKLPWTLTGMFAGRWAVRSGRKIYPERWSQKKIEEVNARRANEPLALLEDRRRVLWYFHERFYWDDEDLPSEDVMALALQKERNQRRKLQSARSLMNAEADGRPIRTNPTTELKRAVFDRDGGKCVECSSTFEIQYDHIIPVARGGATTYENLQILCAECNRAKSDHI